MNIPFASGPSHVTSVTPSVESSRKPDSHFSNSPGAISLWQPSAKVPELRRTSSRWRSLCLSRWPLLELVLQAQPPLPASCWQQGACYSAPERLLEWLMRLQDGQLQLVLWIWTPDKRVLMVHVPQD